VDDSSSPRIAATFELPGVKNNEVTMHLHDGKLHVHGERRPRVLSQNPEVLTNDMVDASSRRLTLPVQELKYGKFQRTLDVPGSLKVSICDRVQNLLCTSDLSVHSTRISLLDFKMAYSL
jgi:Hsp20/alpha crystallin family